MTGNTIRFLVYQQIAKELAENPNRNQTRVQKAVCKRNGVDYDTLSDSDCNWIKSMITTYLR